MEEGFCGVYVRCRRCSTKKWKCLSISICSLRETTRGTRAPSGMQTTDGNSDNFLEELIKLPPTTEL